MPLYRCQLIPIQKRDKIHGKVELMGHKKVNRDQVVIIGTVETLGN